MSRLYLRIWLAVVAALLLTVVGVGWLVRSYYETRIQEQLAATPVQAPPLREVTVRNERGEVMGSATTLGQRVAGQGVAYPVRLSDGRDYTITLGPRIRSASEAAANPPRAELMATLRTLRDGVPPPPPPFFKEPRGLLALVLMLFAAVALGAYPVVRRLTQRLEQLKAGVQRFGDGALHTRVDVRGQDEIAYLAAQFNESAARIEALVGAHKTLLANASHELRSPLARLRMGMELLQTAPTPALHDEMRRSVQELDELIEEILLASRLDAPNATVVSGRLEEVDIVGLLAEESARTGAALDVTANAPGTVLGDAKLLRRLIRNLLENAKRYGGSEVHASWDGKRLMVQDHGPGVPAEERERIFEPFYRMAGASESHGGVGLGLALVRSIARHHHAQVSCINRPDGQRGACFVLHWSAPPA